MSAGVLHSQAQDMAASESADGSTDEVWPEPHRAAVGGPPAKLDPEALELRARPLSVVRFRRGLLIGSAAALSVTIAAAAWFALQPVGLRMAADAPELTPAENDRSPEVLAGLPDGYANEGVPDLGPPLPGDLGRPILEHQRSMATEDGAQEPAPAGPDPAEQAAVAERQRRIAEIEQARAAPVLMQVSRSAGRGDGGAGAPATQTGDMAGKGAARSSNADDGVSSARIRAPASRWQLSAGSVISASLITGLNSDIPGMVVAQVTEPAFDSASGRAVLVPQGARLLGRYDSRVAFGQRRAMLVWERLVMPDGSSLTLDNAPATDAAGYAGVADAVDFHTWRLLKGIGMSTLLSVGTEFRFGGAESELIGALREALQSNADRAGQKIVERNLDIAPTITIRPGFPVRVLVHKDLVLPPWRRGSHGE